MNRSVFVLPSSLTQTGDSFILFCIGLLNDNDTEIIAGSVNSTVGFRNSMYSVSSQRIDNSGDNVAISFSEFLFSHSGNFTCRSRSSGSERTVYISSKYLNSLVQFIFCCLFLQIIYLVPQQCYCHHQ